MTDGMTTWKLHRLENKRLDNINQNLSDMILNLTELTNTVKEIVQNQERETQEQKRDREILNSSLDHEPLITPNHHREDEQQQPTENTSENTSGQLFSTYKNEPRKKSHPNKRKCRHSK
ncbi:hypothetical protein FDP41_009228 [Naegleria fowleri]|uniref:Uncharacterized protein n=1 Tax=Naegleria fowleri TaxID=5763 RepID=A0A6A5BE19_NAEFO|nr:uncharacterized protein FDP41_009228 [Naegleria fowleri]KAF0972325.1 hypothetical protein FDP41_009228 [Naegleria fowleri]